MHTKNIVNIIIEKNNRILMLKRNFKPKGKLDLLGGYVEDGESVESAAVREAKEESGYDVDLVKKLGTFNHFEREKKIHVFVGRIVAGDLKKSEEGTPVWVNVARINKGALAFPQVHVSILQKYGKNIAKPKKCRNSNISL